MLRPSTCTRLTGLKPSSVGCCSEFANVIVTFNMSFSFFSQCHETNEDFINAEKYKVR